MPVNDQDTSSTQAAPKTTPAKKTTTKTEPKSCQAQPHSLKSC
ncbi:hypothetical protein [Moraxella bovoculi]|nr:hypothetical protein [Moraxella bovoculi]